MSKPAQRIVVLLLALALLLPAGIFGISRLVGPSEPTTAEKSTADGSSDGGAGTDPSDPTGGRERVDPSSQPPRPEVPQPAEPGAVREQTAAGAEATVRHLLDSYASMMTSGDTTAWQNAVDPSCRVCTTFIENATLLHKQGGYLVGGEFTVHATRFEADEGGTPPTAGTVTADFHEEPSTIVDDPTLRAQELKAVDGSLQAQVRWDGKRWRVTDMALAPGTSPAN